jgi:hypothetical protein
MDQGEASLADLGSHNGVWVNDERIVASRLLLSGDSVTIGGANLVYHASPSAPRHSQALDFLQLRARLAEEVERAARFSHELTILVLQPAGSPPPRRGASAHAVEADVARLVRRGDIVGRDITAAWSSCCPRPPPPRALAGALARTTAARVGYASLPARRQRPRRAAGRGPRRRLAGEPRPAARRGRRLRDPPRRRRRGGGRRPGDAAAVRVRRAHRRRRAPGPDHRRDRHRQAAGRRGDPRPVGAPARALHGDALRRALRAARSRASCSAAAPTRPAPSVPAASSGPPAAPCSSTRSASSASAPRPACCARSRPATSSASASRASGRSTSASSPPPTTRSRTRSRPAASAATSTSASPAPSCGCRRCATARASCRSSPSASSPPPVARPAPRR